MLKFFFFSFVLAVTTNVVIIKCMPTGSINLGSVTARMLLFKVIKENCYKNATEKEYEKFVKLTDATMECQANKTKQAPIFVAPAQEIKHAIQTCFDDLITELEDCLPEESKDWPQLNIDFVYSMIDFTYENKEELISNDFRNYIMSCIDNLQEEDAKNNMIQCVSGYDSQPLIAKVVCQTMDVVVNCTMTEINKRCPAERKIEDLKVKLVAALKDPCLEYEVTENPVDMLTLLAPFAPPNMNTDLM